MKLALAVALALLPVSAAAQATCPDAATAAKGYTLSSKEGRQIEVHRVEGAKVHYRERFGTAAASVVLEQMSHEGLFLIMSKSPGGELKSEYDDDLSKLFPLKAKAAHDLSYMIIQPDKGVRRAHMTVEVGAAPVPVTVGACTYETWSVKKSILFLENKLLLVMTDLWSPALKIHLRREVIRPEAPGQPPVVTSFDEIKANP